MGKDTPLETRAPKEPSYEDAEDGEEYHESLRGYTRADRADMSRMGKVQELRRNYRPLSALAFTVILQGTWEVLMTWVLLIIIWKPSANVTIQGNLPGAR